MGKIDAFDIILNRAESVYRPGDELSGYVLIKLNESIQINGLEISFRGTSNVSFESLDYYSGELRIYASSEQYFMETYSLITNDKCPKTKCLDAGSHTFQFKYRLLNKLPSSFEGEFGHVRYTIKCYVHRACANDDVTKSAFTVINDLDLTKIERAEQPLHGSNLVTESPFCYCDRGAIMADVRLDKRAYVPGETVLVYAKVCNSTQYLVYCEAQLCQIVLFHTPGKNKESRRVVSSVRHEILDVDDTDVWDGDKLLVPLLPPTNLNACNIIDVHYAMVFKTSADSQSRLEMSIPLEVTIGTMPVKGSMETPKAVVSKSIITSQPNSLFPLLNYNNSASPVKIPDSYPIVPYRSGPALSQVNADDRRERSPPPLYTAMYAEYDVDNDKVTNVCDVT